MEPENNINYRIDQLEKSLQHLDETVNGDGQPGVKQNLASFMKDWQNREEQKATFDDRQDKERQRANIRVSTWFKVIGLLLTATALGLGLLTYFHRNNPTSEPTPIHATP